LLELQQRLYLLVEFLPLSNQNVGQLIPLADSDTVANLWKSLAKFSVAHKRKLLFGIALSGLQVNVELSSFR
jgi:hypothetical protein